MARLCPSLPRNAGAKNSGEYAEFELLETLERGLSAAYTLFHSVDWSRGVGGEEQHGEIDIVVLNQAGDVLLLEVKAGDVEVKPDGIFKTCSCQPKDVTRQINKPAGIPPSFSWGMKAG
ncbi:MAG: hypothetical protein BWK72_19655 [Rhodoferax ferrireducens]|uniref:NERD domain-containing protein n=1 Tax=Rhodoferax ferrireducens TaxID=192843 RepID=A0A1W9KPB8_9BURK|nr:MAG: hypothetical protein BWK72_19655 [Rhodoferax ferrireducens]